MARARANLMVVALLVGLAHDNRDENVLAADDDSFEFINGVIPAETGKSVAILISVGLCKKYNAVASAVAKACSLAQVELWVATSSGKECVFDTSREIDLNFSPTYINAPGAEDAIFVRDFAPTVTVDAETKQPVKALTIRHSGGKNYDPFTTGIFTHLQTRFPQLERIHSANVSSEWGALVTDGDGLCIVSSTLSSASDGLAKWLKQQHVCRETIQFDGIDIATGHADIAMAITGPCHYLFSVPPSHGMLENDQKVLVIQRNLDKLARYAHDTCKEGRSHIGQLPYALTTDLEPASYANALVVTGPGGTYLVLPTYSATYLVSPIDPDNSHVMARNSAKEAWVASLRLSLGIDVVGVIDVEAGDLYTMHGSIHCATKNFPAPPA